MKQCAKCLEPKETTSFYNHPNTIDKLNPYCKSCQKAISNRHDPKYRKEAKYFEWDVNNVTI